MVQRRAATPVAWLSKPASVPWATTSTRGLIPGVHYTRDLLEANKKIWRLTTLEKPSMSGSSGQLDDGASVGLEEWRRTLRMCGRNDESLADFPVRTPRGLAEIVCLTTVILSWAKSSTN